MWIKSNFFKYSIGTILILLIIFLLGQIGFFLEPFKRFLAIIFLPLLVSGILYYLFRPLVKLIVKRLKLPATLAILTVFLVFCVLFYFIGAYAGSIISRQLQLFIDDLPRIVQAINDKVVELMNNENITGLFTAKVQEQLTLSAQKAIPAVSGSLLGAIAAITSMVAVLIVVPFILFYILKDDRVFYWKLLDAIPLRYRRETAEICRETDKTLSTYIIGQAIIALISGILTYIGFLIIGLKYPFILAFFVLITSFIPMFGAIIGTIPALLAGLAINPLMAVKVLVVTIIVQQIEGNLISPNIIGKRMKIHPLTVIIIFLASASLYGIVGMLVAVPAYAVIKVLAGGAVRIYKIWKGRSAFAEKQGDGM